MEARTAKTWLRALSQACYYALEWPSSVNPFSVAISHRTRRYLPLVKRCVPCAFDPAVFYPGVERSQEPSILFVAGTLQGRKRGGLLLETFDKVRRTVPDARLTIVSRDDVTQPGVTCLSDLNASDLGTLYRSHWLLCSTSSYEGFGVPYVEALASGLPIVTTPNDGALEILRGGELGVVCSPEGLAQEIVALIRDGVRRERLRSTGLIAAERYRIGVVVGEYRKLYNELVAGAPGRHLLAGRTHAGGGDAASGSGPRASNQPSTSHGKGATA